ncbi:MAG: D-glycero-beta-D-manno-heptose 1-phosphate adenylyltransferase [Chitinophagales bacterium]
MQAFQQLKSKIFDKAALKRKINLWRFRDDKIVFTNGCFDLLHAGHISTIAQAADFGDRLVLGLNSDSSVKRLKGESRPLQNEQNRAILLAAMHCVDAVVVFEEDTPEDLIKFILPDVLVKGGDYKPEEVVGADIVLKNGGEIKLAEFLPGFSSSGLIEQINRK